MLANSVRSYEITLPPLRSSDRGETLSQRRPYAVRGFLVGRAVLASDPQAAPP
jgi:hypothetical protein